MNVEQATTKKEHQVNKEAFIRDLIGKMTIEQKIGATCTFAFAGTFITPDVVDQITKYHCGGLRLHPHARMFGTYVDSRTGKTSVKIEHGMSIYKDADAPVLQGGEYRDVVGELQKIALERPLGIPLHFSIDMEAVGKHGCDNLFPGFIFFPNAMGITATGDKTNAYEAARTIARQARAMGITNVHGPVVDINVNPLNPEIGIRAYGDTVETVVEYAKEAARGYADGGVVAALKHFPGRGDSAMDAHYDMPIIRADRETFHARELQPYKELIREGLAPSVMIGHSIFPAFDEEFVSSVSKKIITDLLRAELGYEGVVTTDSMTMGGVAKRYGIANACAMAIEAGADLVLMKAQNNLVSETFEAIRSFVEMNRITEDDLDRKIFRVLSMKYDIGLFKNKQVESLESIISDTATHAIALQAARDSIIQDRIQPGILPFSDDDGKSYLLVEQSFLSLRHSTIHPGLIYKNLSKKIRNLRYLETSIEYDAEDKKNLDDLVPNADTVVLTSIFERGSASNCDYIDELIDRFPEKDFIILSNTPYHFSIPEKATNLFVFFTYTDKMAEAITDALCGTAEVDGRWPVATRPSTAT